MNSAYLEYLKRYRSTIQLVIWFLILLSFLVVNFGPVQISDQNLFLANIIVVSTLAFTTIYYYFFVPHIESRVLITAGTLIYAFFAFIIVWLSGGYNSLLIGLLIVPITITGMMLGLADLIAVIVLEYLFLLPSFYYLYQEEGLGENLLKLLQLAFTILIIGVVSAVNTKEVFRRTEEGVEMKKKTAKLMELSKVKDDFIAMASHNLRTPVGSIRGYLDIFLRGDGGKLTKDQKTILENIKTNNDRLFEMVEDLINISVIEAGDLTLFKQPIDIEQVISEGLEETFSVRAKEKGIDLKLTRSKTKLPLAEVDIRRFKEALYGILDNAVKFTHKGSVTIGVERDGDYLIIAVADTGPGIADEEMNKLFEKFHRVGGSLNFSEAGSGLGLYISKLIVEAHGGKIWVKSKIGEGSVFYFSVPVMKEG